MERVTDLEYNLYLNFDFNTQNYTQWYYFAVRNVKKGRSNAILIWVGFTYKLNIMNLQKDESSYSQGMKPFVYQTAKNKENGTNQWIRGCQNVTYVKN